jgi:hypothetical protein
MDRPPRALPHADTAFGSSSSRTRGTRSRGNVLDLRGRVRFSGVMPLPLRRHDEPSSPRRVGSLVARVMKPR